MAYEVPMLRALALAAALLIAPAAAEASEPATKAEAAGAPYVDISPVGVPIVVGGKIVNYVFVNVRIDLAPFANTVKLRDREPYFRDALVRAAHATPFTLKSDYTKVDEAALKAAVMRDATRLAGPGVVKGVTVMSQAPRTTRVPKGS